MWDGIRRQFGGIKWSRVGRSAPACGDSREVKFEVLAWKFFCEIAKRSFTFDASETVLDPFSGVSGAVDDMSQCLGGILETKNADTESAFNISLDWFFENYLSGGPAIK